MVGVCPDDSQSAPGAASRWEQPIQTAQPEYAPNWQCWPGAASSAGMAACLVVTGSFRWRGGRHAAACVMCACAACVCALVARAGITST
jgi:hypothetical protein